MLNRQRGAITPRIRNFQVGLISQLVRRNAFRIKHELIPVQNRKLSGGRASRRKLAAFRRRDVIEHDLKHRSPCRHVDVKREHIDAVAFPGDELIAGLDLQSNQVGYRSCGHVLARNPFWIQQRHRSGLGGHADSHVKQSPGSVGRVDTELHGRVLGRQKGQKA